jgi:hypothetical protein
MKIKTGLKAWRQRGRLGVFSAAVAAFILLSVLFGVLRAEQTVLRISDWQTGAVYAVVPVKAGDRLFFGWIHSLEHIPWNEYYHVGKDRTLVLDTITFPAFGAGIPEDKGERCRIEGGLIYMEEIGQVFSEIVWLNSHTATQEIRLNDRYITRGSELPQHQKLRLAIERRGLYG